MTGDAFHEWQRLHDDFSIIWDEVFSGAGPDPKAAPYGGIVSYWTDEQPSRLLRLDRDLTAEEFEQLRARWGERPGRTLFLPPSAALTPTITRGCAHPNAEPVELITGEIVAAVCVDCLQTTEVDP